uniref:Uncharacterized protein n=1 Tax=Lepeophtheirus salmonis TaxID=72036 RepID=A0A0K2VF12_LEPSM
MSYEFSLESRVKPKCFLYELDKNLSPKFMLAMCRTFQLDL